MALNGGMVVSGVSNTPSSPKCLSCGSSWHAAHVVVNAYGEHFWMCDDLVACSRRAMVASGIRVLPHPKNPERCVLVD